MVDAKKAQKTKIIWGVVAAVIIGAAFLSMAGAGGDYKDFASCLSDRGAVMYGAFWCPHCSDQKVMFGADFKHINYVECSNSDRSQTAECTAAGIQSYPTWRFADGSERGGVLSFAQLAQITGCEQP